MRIWVWTERYWPNIGGIETIVVNLLASLRPFGHEFMIITGKDPHDLPDVEEHNGIVVHRFPFHRALARRDMGEIVRIRQRLSRLKKEFAPELIHMHDVFPGAIFQAMDRESPAALLVTVHFSLVDPWRAENGLFAQTMRQARWVAACSQAALDGILRVVPELSGRCCVIRNGVKAPATGPTPISFDPPRLLCRGRLSVGKGYDLAVSALATIKDRFPGIRLAISGDGPERSNLEAHARGAGVADIVDFLGQSGPEAAWRLTSDATMVLMPSRQEGSWSEGLPLVALEASLMERPVIASRTGGLPEAVADGRTGILVESGNVSALAQAMVKLLENPELARAMGKAGRRRTLEELDWDNCFVPAYQALYQRLQGPR